MWAESRFLVVSRACRSLMSVSSVGLSASETEDRPDLEVLMAFNIFSSCVICCNAALGVAGVVGGGSGGVLGSSSGVPGH